MNSGGVGVIYLFIYLLQSLHLCQYVFTANCEHAGQRPNTAQIPPMVRLDKEVTVRGWVILERRSTIKLGPENHGKTGLSLERQRNYIRIHETNITLT